MSYFGLNPVNQNQQLDEAASNPAGFNSDVGFFDNAVGAALSGLYSGLVAKPDQLLDWPPESPDNQYHLFK